MQEGEFRHLTRLVIALIRQSGGEIRLKRAELSGIDEGLALIEYDDDITNEVVMRFGPQGAKMYVVGPTADKAATQAQAQRLSQRSTIPASPIMSEEELAAMEERQLAESVNRVRRPGARGEAGAEALPFRIGQHPTEFTN